MRRYGFLVVLFLLWLASIVLYGQTAKPDEFWPGVWENLQSEWAQLFVQGLLMIAFEQYVTAKASENTKRDVKEAIEELVRDLSSLRPQNEEPSPS